MIVRLKRDLFLGGMLFRASRFGVEIPDVIEGKPVVLAADKKGDCIVLPKDAERLDKQLPSPAPKKDEPVALSQLNKREAKPKTFVEAMEDNE